MKWKVILAILGTVGVVSAVLYNRYRDSLNIALNIPWKVHCSWVEEVPEFCLEADCNEKVFKAFHVFRAGTGKYGLKRRMDSFDGAPSIAWLLIEDGKATCGYYGHSSIPRAEKREMHRSEATELTIGYFRKDKYEPRMGHEWIQDESGLAISNEHYMIQFTKPKPVGGF